MKKVCTLFHPESPGIKIKVRRGFFARLFKNRNFATIAEARRYHDMIDAKRKRLEEINGKIKERIIAYNSSNSLFRSCIISAEISMLHQEYDVVRSAEVIA